MTWLFHLQENPTLSFNSSTYVFSFFRCYFRGESVHWAFSLVVDFGFGYEKSPLQHGGFGCLGRLNTQVMKCLFMVMSLNPALLISTADFTCLRQGQREIESL